jgi:ComF family protein
VKLAAAKLSGLLAQVVDFCYPGRCAACDAGVEGPTFLCESCEPELQKLESAAGCTWCGRPIPEVGAPCPYCLGEGIAHYDRVIRLGTFSDPLKHLIHQMKYHRRWGLAESLVDRLLAQERVKGVLTETDVIVPVPLHRLRQVVRGYNQAEVMAKRLARACRVRVRRPVVRLRATESQTEMTSAQAREDNLRNAFGLVNPKGVTGKHVLVVDDVMTTGATLRAVARALRPAKPVSLSALVIAVADPKNRDFQTI